MVDHLVLDLVLDQILLDRINRVLLALNLVDLLLPDLPLGTTKTIGADSGLTMMRIKTEMSANPREDDTIHPAIIILTEIRITKRMIKSVTIVGTPETAKLRPSRRPLRAACPY